MNKLFLVGLLVAGAVSSSHAVRGLTGQSSKLTPIVLLAGASAVAGAVMSGGKS